MFPLNKKLFLLCVYRGKFLQNLITKNVLETKFLKFLSCSVSNRTKKENISLLFTPVPVKPTPQQEIGAELVGELDKLKIVKAINLFYRHKALKNLAEENGLDDYIFQKGLANFRKFCLEAKTLPPDLHIIISDIENGAGNPIDLFPYFVKHVREMFPHLDCVEDLKKIGDLRSPANWYPNTRCQLRKVIFHCGPTNSGKTYHAIQSFIKSKCGVYCGPLKLLAVEVFNKANEQGTPCDLITGEEIIYSRPDGDLSNHVSCTVEMCSVEKQYDIAVIDEIQLIKDPQRGWAWTRALLGLRAKEIHLCGEEAALHLIDSILCTTNEELEVKKYKRLSKLSLVDSVESFENVCPGDCIVCFNKNDIYHVTQALEEINVKVAVIYGALPPGTKLSQCKKFNDPDDPCKVLVATDAVGMGLNLSIRRVVFYSIIKPIVNELGEKEMGPISVSQALQIAGRAGRFGTQYKEGFVTTFKSKDLPLLKSLLQSQPDPVLSAGLLPSVDQIELYSYYLPNSTLSSLLEIFVKLSTVDDSLYFMCDLKDFRYLADMIEHVPLPIRIKYTFCCSPINKRLPFVCSMFLKFAKMYSENNAITFDWVCKNINWPLKFPRSLRELMQLEAVHDVFDLYLWLSYRFPDYFPDGDSIKETQKELDSIILEGVIHLTKLLKAVTKTAERKENDLELTENVKNRFLSELKKELGDDVVESADKPA